MSQNKTTDEEEVVIVDDDDKVEVEVEVEENSISVVDPSFIGGIISIAYTIDR